MKGDSVTRSESIRGFDSRPRLFDISPNSAQYEGKISSASPNTIFRTVIKTVLGGLFCQILSVRFWRETVLSRRFRRDSPRGLQRNFTSPWRFLGSCSLID